MFPARFASSALVALAFLVGCKSSGSTTVTPPSSPPVVTIFEGNSQTATVGAAVAVAPAVRVLSAAGAPVRDFAVTFGVATGGGSVTGATQITDPLGIARVGSWVLGQAPGANTLTATATGATGSPLTFSATGVVGAAATVSKQSGDAQFATVGSAVAVRPSVKVVDQFGNAVVGVTVTFAVASGGGSITGGSQLTAADGIATVGTWTLGAAGTNTLTATAGLLSTTFTATAQAVLNAPQYAGTYSGTWTNTTFASTGTGQAIIAVNAGASTANITVNVTGNVLGTGGVPQTIRSGAYGATSAAFTGSVPVMGTITASIDATGHIIASGINVPNAAITRWDANGTITATTLTLNFTVTFTAGPPAIGSINLVKGP